MLSCWVMSCKWAHAERQTGTHRSRTCHDGVQGAGVCLKACEAAKAGWCALLPAAELPSAQRTCGIGIRRQIAQLETRDVPVRVHAFQQVHHLGALFVQDLFQLVCIEDLVHSVLSPLLLRPSYVAHPDCTHHDRTVRQPVVTANVSNPGCCMPCAAGTRRLPWHLLCSRGARDEGCLQHSR